MSVPESPVALSLFGMKNYLAFCGKNAREGKHSLEDEGIGVRISLDGYFMYGAPNANVYRPQDNTYDI